MELMEREVPEENQDLWEIQDVKELLAPQELRETQDLRDLMELLDLLELPAHPVLTANPEKWDLLDNQVFQDNKDHKAHRETGVAQAERAKPDPRDKEDPLAMLDLKVKLDHVESLDLRVFQDRQDLRAPRDQTDSREPQDPLEPKESQAEMENQEAPETTAQMAVKDTLESVVSPEIVVPQDP